MTSHVNIDNMTIDDIENTIHSYQQNLKQIESTLEMEEINEDNNNVEDIAKKKALVKLKKDLQNAIAFFESALIYKRNENEFNKDTDINDAYLNKCANVYYEPDDMWYNAIIKTINHKSKTCTVEYFGYKEDDVYSVVPFKYVKPHIGLNVEEVFNGMICDVIYKEDGLWYNATIQRVSELGVHVKYNKYETEEIVQCDYLRETPEQKVKNWNLKEQMKKEKESNLKSKIDLTAIDGEEIDINNTFIHGNNNSSSNGIMFNIPEKLKINPNDSEEQRLLKRKRVKQLKNKQKQKEIEKITQEKQQNWIDFNKKLKSTNYPHFRTLTTFKPKSK